MWDARQAARWMQQHADTFGIDPNKMVSFGASAGGLLAMWTAIPTPPASPMATQLAAAQDYEPFQVDPPTVCKLVADFFYNPMELKVDTALEYISAHISSLYLSLSLSLTFCLSLYLALPHTQVPVAVVLLCPVSDTSPAGYFTPTLFARDGTRGEVSE